MKARQSISPTTTTSHEHARTGMGALRASLEALYNAVAGKELKTVAFGKPQMGTFRFATRLLGK